MKCSYCSKEAITNVGFAYCEDHLGNFESGFFEKAIIEKLNDKEEREKFFIWAFGSEKPKLSDLQKWHNRLPRKERPPGEQNRSIYVEEQDTYIQRILEIYLGSGA
jgi:hypothetical protein